MSERKLPETGAETEPETGLDWRPVAEVQVKRALSAVVHHVLPTARPVTYPWASSCTWKNCQGDPRRSASICAREHSPDPCICQCCTASRGFCRRTVCLPERLCAGREISLSSRKETRLWQVLAWRPACFWRPVCLAVIAAHHVARELRIFKSEPSAHFLSLV